MSMRIAGWLVLVCLLSAPLGCSSDVAALANQPTTSRLGDSIDLSLADLLGQSREHLTQLYEETATKVRIQEKGIHAGTLHLSLLPDLHLPLVLPVWRQCSYSNKQGFSLPAYASDQAKDSALAVHVARYGDTEAARQLVEPGDTAALEQIEKYRYEREYPVEWTRLVALLLHAAQLRLATGDVDGGTELLVLHRQLREVLDAKAAQGPLGADLLARGWKTFTAAAAAWRAEKKLELAGQAYSVVAAWGTPPPLTLPLPFGMPRTELAGILKSAAQGRALLVASTNRAFDLFDLPFPDEGAEAVIACFNAAGNFDELFISYRSGFSHYYPEPENLARALEDSRITGKNDSAGAGLRRAEYRISDVACEVTMVTSGAGLGGLVRLGNGPANYQGTTLARDFGVVNLDRSFEQNRIRSAPEQKGDSFVVKQPKFLGELTNPICSLKPAEALVRQVAGHNLTASMTLVYATDPAGLPPFHQVVLPLWATLGTGRIEGATDQNGGHLALSWEDPRTRYALSLPYENGLPVQLEVNDRQGTEQVAEREAGVARLDRQERQERLAANKPLVRVWRHLEQVELGMDRPQVLRVLPSGHAVLKRDIPGGLMVTFNGEPGRSDAYVARQLFIRFDNSGRATELRARYVDGPSGGTKAWMDELLKNIKAGCGAPHDAKSPWARLWGDGPANRHSARCCFWQDDLTHLTYQRDGGGVEVILHDASPEGSTLPPFEYLPRGPEGCVLGEERSKLLQQLGTDKPTTAEDGALVVRPSGQSPYDAVLVWFEGDRIVRIIARHVSVNFSKGDPGQAVTGAWGQELSALGWPRRHDTTPHDLLQCMGWHDDRTRIRIFWQEDDSGSIHLFTEWQALHTSP
jgi:hypothetical protein